MTWLLCTFPFTCPIRLCPVLLRMKWNAKCVQWSISSDLWPSIHSHLASCMLETRAFSQLIAWNVCQPELRWAELGTKGSPHLFAIILMLSHSLMKFTFYDCVSIYSRIAQFDFTNCDVRNSVRTHVHHSLHPHLSITTWNRTVETLNVYSFYLSAPYLPASMWVSWYTISTFSACIVTSSSSYVRSFRFLIEN